MGSPTFREKIGKNKRNESATNISREIPFATFSKDKK